MVALTLTQNTFIPQRTPYDQRSASRPYIIPSAVVVVVVVAAIQGAHNHRMVEDHCCDHHAGRCDSHHAEQESNRDHVYLVRVCVRVRGHFSKDEMKEQAAQPR